MSRLIKSSITIAPDLYDAARERSKSLTYDSFSAYIVGLIRADIITLPAHDLPLKIAGMDGRTRDKIDAAMLKQILESKPVEIPMREESDDIIEIAAAYRSKRIETLPRSAPISSVG